MSDFFLGKILPMVNGRSKGDWPKENWVFFLYISNEKVYVGFMCGLFIFVKVKKYFFRLKI